jgi:hypothetical protein
MLELSILHYKSLHIYQFLQNSHLAVLWWGTHQVVQKMSHGLHPHLRLHWGLDVIPGALECCHNYFPLIINQRFWLLTKDLFQFPEAVLGLERSSTVPFYLALFHSPSNILEACIHKPNNGEREWCTISVTFHHLSQSLLIGTEPQVYPYSRGGHYTRSLALEIKDYWGTL